MDVQNKTTCEVVHRVTVQVAQSLTTLASPAVIYQIVPNPTYQAAQIKLLYQLSWSGQVFRYIPKLFWKNYETVVSWLVVALSSVLNRDMARKRMT